MQTVKDNIIKGLSSLADTEKEVSEMGRVGRRTLRCEPPADAARYRIY
jgi:hypothetical protein